MLASEFDAWWKYLAAAAAFFAFVLRMEARISAAHAKIEVMQSQRKEDLEASNHARAEFKEVLTQIQNEMRAEMRDMKADIKSLLREHGK